MNNFVLLVTILSAATSSSFYVDLDLEWNSWKLTYEKNYSSYEEEQFRRGIWEATWIKVQEHNKRADEGKESYWMETNHFADKTSKELLSHCCLPPMKHYGNYRQPDEVETMSPLAQRFDWRDKGCVTPAKNQRSTCQSCWIFSAVGTIESHSCIKNGKLQSLSEQQVMDCGGFINPCEPNYPEKALSYVKSAHALMREKDYPYDAMKGPCLFKNSKDSVKINQLSYTFIKTEDDMARKVQQNGPVIFGMHVTVNFHYFSKGIYDEPNCSNGYKHAMIIVGYGHENGHDYWLIKNSWGTKWGDEGFGKIRRNVRLCGITQHVLDVGLQ